MEKGVRVASSLKMSMALVSEIMAGCLGKISYYWTYPRSS